eukprot:TRINITY_DN12767_c0_g1_i8.p1 TRINITY_DN12767_c0_g1~~TRINITY_DN12767_c0_g1_i8.p1  ORF type:complete len:101 (-),score=10.75 TRINITY_DN12767_c0_g1_i8:269-571(-)
MFLKDVDASGIYKDATYMSELFLLVVEEVGPSKVVQILTNNAVVCKAAGKLVEGKYPHIFRTPMNLALKNICQPKNTPQNERRFAQLEWIVEIERAIKRY